MGHSVRGRSIIGTHRSVKTEIWRQPQVSKTCEITASLNCRGGSTMMIISNNNNTKSHKVSPNKKVNLASTKRRRRSEFSQNEARQS